MKTIKEIWGSITSVRSVVHQSHPLRVWTEGSVLVIAHLQKEAIEICKDEGIECEQEESAWSSLDEDLIVALNDNFEVVSDEDKAEYVMTCAEWVSAAEGSGFIGFCYPEEEDENENEDSDAEDE